MIAEVNLPYWPHVHAVDPERIARAGSEGCQSTTPYG